MKRSMLVIPLLVLFAACGDDGGGVSLEDYFSDLELAGVAYSEATAPLDAALDVADDPVNDLKALFPAFLDELESFVRVLEAMPPAAEVAAQHATTVSDGRAAIAVFEDLITEMEGVEDLAGLYAVLDGAAMAAVAEAGGRFSGGCAALQSIADEEGIEVDLRCG